MPGAALSLALAAAVLAPLVDNGQLGAGWRVAGLPNQTKPLTKFSAEAVGDKPAVRLDADRSYGNLIFDLEPQSARRTLRWSWRVDQGNPAIDLSRRGGDDMPAKVCASFDMALDKVPFVERQLLRGARANTGEALPAATLCWVWGGKEAREALMPSAFTGRVRYIVLRNGADGSGSWFDEKRDIAADFKRAFGDESDTLPALSAVLVGADADNTAMHTVAHVAGLRLEP